MPDVTLGALADCVRLGVDVQNVQQRARRRGTYTVRIATGELLRVTTIRGTLIKVRPAFTITDDACAAANLVGLDAHKMLQLLKTVNPAGGTVTAGPLALSAIPRRNAWVLSHPVWTAAHSLQI